MRTARGEAILPALRASSLLASCNMATLYLRNVPDDVMDRLARLAAGDGTSVSALALRELAFISRRADNPELLSALPDMQVKVTDILDDLAGERATR